MRLTAPVFAPTYHQKLLHSFVPRIFKTPPQTASLVPSAPGSPGSEGLRLPHELSVPQHQSCHKTAMSRAIGTYQEADGLSPQTSVRLTRQNQFAAGAEARMLRLLTGLHGLQTAITHEIS